VSEVVNVLIALNAESMDLHLAEVSTDGVVVFDSGKSQDASGNGNLLGVPLESLARERGGNKLMASGAATSSWPIRWRWELPWAWSGMTWGRSAMCCGSISGAGTAATPT